MFCFAAAFLNSKRCVLFFFFELAGYDLVNLRERRLFLFQVSEENVDVLLVAFEEDFDSCVASISNVSVELVEDCSAVDERAETHALNDSCDSDF